MQALQAEKAATAAALKDAAVARWAAGEARRDAATARREAAALRAQAGATEATTVLAVQARKELEEERVLWNSILGDNADALEEMASRMRGRVRVAEETQPQPSKRQRQ